MKPRSLAEHAAVVLAGSPHMSVLDVSLTDAAGAMLADDLVASSPLPPWDTALVDGYAVRASDLADASLTSPVALVVSHDVSFDARGPRQLVPGAAARIASGAPIPVGADAVVPTAHTNGDAARVAITVAPSLGDQVKTQGFDVAEASVVVPQGTRLTARHVAIAAALGHSRLTVRPVPRVVILAVGSELIEPGTTRPGGGVNESTSHLLAVAVREAGAHAYRAGIVSDDRHDLRAVIEDLLVRADVIITTGGLSESHGDTLTHVLKEFGDVEFVEVALEPGRRHGFGHLGLSSERAVTVFALPGSPVAAAAAFETYVRPALRAMSGRTEHERRQVIATVHEGWHTTEGVSHFMPVTLAGSDSEGYRVSPTGLPHQLPLAALAVADGYVLAPPTTIDVRDGDAVSVTLWEG